MTAFIKCVHSIVKGIYRCMGDTILLKVNVCSACQGVKCPRCETFSERRTVRLCIFHKVKRLLSTPHTELS